MACRFPLDIGMPLASVTPPNKLHGIFLHNHSEELLCSLFECCTNNFPHDRGDKVASDGFQETNKYLDSEKIYLVPKAKKVITPFIQK